MRGPISARFFELLFLPHGNSTQDTQVYWKSQHSQNNHCYKPFLVANSFEYLNVKEKIPQNYAVYNENKVVFLKIFLGNEKRLGMEQINKTKVWRTYELISREHTKAPSIF